MADVNGTENATDPTVEEIFDSVMNCQPLVERDIMGGWEDLMNGEGALAIARRLGLAMAIQDGSFFKRVAEERDCALTAAGQLEAIESAADAYRELADTMRAAAMRTSVALCAHDDMEKILVEAKAHAVITDGPKSFEKNLVR